MTLSTQPTQWSAPARAPSSLGVTTLTPAAAPILSATCTHALILTLTRCAEASCRPLPSTPANRAAGQGTAAAARRVGSPSDTYHANKIDESMVEDAPSANSSACAVGPVLSLPLTVTSKMHLSKMHTRDLGRRARLAPIPTLIPIFILTRIPSLTHTLFLTVTFTFTLTLTLALSLTPTLRCAFFGYGSRSTTRPCEGTPSVLIPRLCGRARYWLTQRRLRALTQAFRTLSVVRALPQAVPTTRAV